MAGATETPRYRLTRLPGSRILDGMNGWLHLKLWIKISIRSTPLGNMMDDGRHRRDLFWEKRVREIINTYDVPKNVHRGFIGSYLMKYALVPIGAGFLRLLLNHL